jgi:hypothetical protein
MGGRITHLRGAANTAMPIRSRFGTASSFRAVELEGLNGTALDPQVAIRGPCGMPFLVVLVLFLLSVSAAAQDGPPRSPINTLREIGPALFACWTPQSEAHSFQVTIRLSFKRNGEVLGRPFITFSQFNGDVADQKRPWVRS